jgi:hypothetical protein
MQVALRRARCYHSYVAVRISSHNFRGVGVTVPEGHGRVNRAVDHMKVGYDVIGVRIVHYKAWPKHAWCGGLLAKYRFNDGNLSALYGNYRAETERGVS